MTSESHLYISKLAGNTSLTENELDLLEDRSGIAPRQRDNTLPSEDQPVEANLDLAATITPTTIGRPSRKLEHVYVWDCGKCLCVSNLSTMNKVIRILLIFFQVFLFVSSSRTSFLAYRLIFLAFEGRCSAGPYSASEYGS